MSCDRIKPAVTITNLSKSFKIYKQPHHRIKQCFSSCFRCLTRKEKKHHYKPYQALMGVSLEIKKGESFGIIGCNGSGKSTLLQLLCGTLFPDSGQVDISGRLAALLELGSGFNPEFTGKENVYLNASLLGLTKKEIDAKYESIVTFAEIGEHINLPTKTYSSGMTVRLAFSVIAHVDAEIIVVDEALAVGDANFTKKCMAFFHDFMKTGTLIFVSHDIHMVKAICGRAIWLENGFVREQGDATTVTDAYLSYNEGTHSIDKHPQTETNNDSEKLTTCQQGPATHATVEA